MNISKYIAQIAGKITVGILKTTVKPHCNQGEKFNDHNNRLIINGLYQVCY